jgi:hypothetical protein
LAEPGGICISRVVCDQIRDKLPYPFEDRGEQSVKNIVRSVQVYALRPEAVAEMPISAAPSEQFSLGHGSSSDGYCSRSRGLVTMRLGRF